MFNPLRLSLARRRRKLTKKALAEAVGFDQKTVIRYEAGEVEPPADSIAALSAALDFPESFFFGTDVDEPQAEAASFRSLSSMSARDRDGALAAGAFAFLLSDWVDERFKLPIQDLLDCKEDSDPEAAARMLRQKWGLGERPVRNMVHLLESKGVRVFSLAENTQTVDAFSMWRNNTPYVFLNTFKTAERSRFDAAHELGHLVLHKHGGPQGGRIAEDQANQFASAFLMPEAEVRAKLPRIGSLSEIVEAKRYWRVSVAALNYRLHKLGITTDWQYRNFCIQIAERFRKSEPYGIEREESIVWEKVLADLRSTGTTKRHIASDIGLPVTEIENLLFRLTNMQTLSGKGTGSGQSRAKLSLVQDDDLAA
ncbi:MAG TPA: XRE family transcriptional regulator [Noviherbaspirillum sp.]|jgi:Zn-dependent peptidase ImmA (M78 family)/DNA-binding XRE family transcriptional regulator|uniref:helix-turn-helix domain-containing protein n=1 Tax=Noviherbaspirillum sp. TaxID=1926288 RepID=UPI002F92899E